MNLFVEPVHAKGTLGVPYRELTQEVIQFSRYKHKINIMLFKCLFKFRYNLHLMKKNSI